MALMINGFISMSVWTKCHVFLRQPHGASLQKESFQVPLRHRGIVEGPAGPSEPGPADKAERQLDAASNQGRAALSRLQKITNTP